MNDEKASFLAFITVGSIFLIPMLLISGFWIDVTFFWAKVDNDFDNYCWSSASIALSNLTATPFFDLGNKCCARINGQLKCVPIDKEKEKQWREEWRS